MPRPLSLRFYRLCEFNLGGVVGSLACLCWLLLLLLLFTRPLPRDGGMAEDHGTPEAGQLPRVWTRGHKETESRQRVSGAKSP